MTKGLEDKSEQAGKLTWSHFLRTWDLTPWQGPRGMGQTHCHVAFQSLGSKGEMPEFATADGEIGWKKIDGKIGSEAVHIRWNEQQYSLTVLYQGYVSSPTSCLNIVRRDLDHLDNLQHITLIRHINKINTWLVCWRPREGTCAPEGTRQSL